MKIFILLIIFVVLYFIAKNYKTEKFQNINLNEKENFEGDLENHEAGLLIALLAKVAKADGRVGELEAELLRLTFTDVSAVFSNAEEIREKLKIIYKKEKENFENTIEVCEKIYTLTRFSYSKRLKIMEFLLNMAFIDGEFSNAEKMITEDIANALKIRRNDYINLITNFEAFYRQKSESKQMDYQNACRILGVQENDDKIVIKKAYRKLVRKYHPDIIMGQGASEDIIEEATKKLQEINEAYEVVKKQKEI